MAQGDWLDEALDELINQIEWSVMVPGAVEIDRNKQQLAKTEVIEAIRKRMAAERIEAYRDMASKSGTGTTMRLYALSRAQELEQRQQGGE